MKYPDVARRYLMVKPETIGRKIAGRRIVRYADLQERGIGFCRVHLRRLELSGRFPLHVNVGPNSIAWFQDEVDDFLAQLVEERERRLALQKGEVAPQPTPMP